MSAITKGDAKDFRRWLVEKNYSQATVSGFVNKTRQLFNDAIDHGLLSINPFRKVGGGSQVNEECQFFVSREAIDRVIAVAPNDKWKLLIALGRYGGFRILSEVVGLKISNIDLERRRVTIASPKTEKQAKPKRVIPLWSELRPLILKVLQKASSDQARLLPFIFPGYNPHTQLVRLIKKRWTRSLAEGVAEPSFHPRDRTAAGFSDPCRLRMDWEHRADCSPTLSSSRFRPRHWS